MQDPAGNDLSWLFVEHGFNYLRNDGELAYIVPDTNLAARSHKEARSIFLDWVYTNASISLPHETFQTETSAKTSVIFGKPTVQSHRDMTDDYPVFMAEDAKIGHDPQANAIHLHDPDAKTELELSRLDRKSFSCHDVLNAGTIQLPDTDLPAIHHKIQEFIKES
jgi:type I restriction-modification system DNA methylase subunit